MEVAVLLVLLLQLSINGPDQSYAVNPGCECVMFTSTFGKDRGTFNSPDYPKPYPRPTSCLLYTFIAPQEHIVELTFQDFDVYKSHMDCSKGDYMKVYPHVLRGEINEYSEGSSAICGGRTDLPPQPLYSSTSALVLEFHAESPPSQRVNSTGFIGHFRFISRKQFESTGNRVGGSVCDEVFHSGQLSRPHGRFYSPRYPAVYPTNIRCNYTFKARLKERIRIVFEEIVLQRGDITCLNRADIVKVIDGEGGRTIALLCNEVAEVEVLSTGSELLVEFTANSDWPGQGFKASYQFQPPDSDNLAITSDAEQKLQTSQRIYTVIGPEVSATTSSCDAVFSSDAGMTGVFSSPSWPGPYPARSHCRYDFLARGRQRIQITFTDFNLYSPPDDSKDCENVDSLQAYVYIDGRLEKIDSFCGSTLPRPIMSNGPRMTLEFRGIYSSRQTKGFRANFTFTDNFGITSGEQLGEYPCAFVFNSSKRRNGTFTSPNFPGAYPRDTECHYFFHGTNKDKVHIQFVYFDVEGVLPCEAVSASDYVEFSNFIGRDKKYNRYCGQLKEFHISSDRKFFRVTFRSNDRLDGTGFKANYQFLDEIESYKTKPDMRNCTSVNGALKGLLFIILILSIGLETLNKQHN